MKKFQFKKKLIIFDLDGVLIDSKLNMKYAWLVTKKKYSLKANFKKYFENVGKPFEKILQTLNIFNNQKEIKKEFSNQSIKNIHKIKLFNNAKQILKFIKKKKILSAIVTSKDLIRTKKILKHFNLKVDFIQCPSKNLRGKPYPDQLLRVIKKAKSKKKECVYIGDTIYDKKAADKAGIEFVLASYGYKIGIKKNKFILKNISEIKKII